MEYLLLALAVVCALLGLLGAVLPMLPGAPLSYAALWLVWFYDSSSMPAAVLWVMGVLMVLLLLLDYVAPIWLTKLGGGSKYSMWGATLGVFAGLFFLPWGLVLGPFVGAFLGELMAHATTGKALWVAMLSFVSFLLTTGIKLFYAIAAMVLWAVCW